MKTSERRILNSDVISAQTLEMWTRFYLMYQSYVPLQSHSALTRRLCSLQWHIHTHMEYYCDALYSYVYPMQNHCHFSVNFGALHNAECCIVGERDAPCMLQFIQVNVLVVIPAGGDHFGTTITHITIK